MANDRVAIAVGIREILSAHGIETTMVTGHIYPYLVIPSAVDLYIVLGPDHIEVSNNVINTRKLFYEDPNIFDQLYETVKTMLARGTPPHKFAIER